jgi:uncharacterized protein YjbI with pentapeptide repeats
MAGVPRLTVIVKATFGMVPDGPAQIAAPVDLVREDRGREGPVAGGPPASGAAAALEEAAEVAPYLPSAGVVLSGHACAPPGRPVSGMVVRLAVYRDGPVLDKSLHVFGYRAPIASTAPQPFQQIPLVYERAYGGPSVDDNPAGVGASAGSRTLPNVIDPTDPQRPAGFGPIPRHWPARRRLLGRVDPAVLGPPIAEIPEGFDFRWFHAAPGDQQVEYLHGDEWIVVDGMHAAMPHVQTRLPSAQAEARCYALGASGWEPGLPIELSADTLIIDADRQICSVIWRGHLVLEQVGAEALHRLRVFAGVALPESPLAWPDPAEIAPPAPPPAPEPVVDFDEHDGTQRIVISKIARSVLPFKPATPFLADDIEERTGAVNMGALQQLSTPFPLAAPGPKAVSPVVPLPGAPWSAVPAEPAPEDDDPDNVTIDRRRVIRSHEPALLIEVEDTSEPATLRPPPPPPRVVVPLLPVAPAFEPDLDDIPTPLPPPPPPAPPPAPIAPEDHVPRDAQSTALRERVSAALAAREALRGIDLTGADLRGIDLRGAQLSSCRLSGANLRRCNLTGARLMDAQLADADLGGAVLTGADLTRADLTRATLAGADLGGALLIETNLSFARAAGARFAGATGRRASFARGIWDDAIFDGMDVTGADFTGASLSGARFAGASLADLRLDDAQGERVSFEDARIPGVHAEGATLTASSFDRAEAPGSVWERATLDGATFRDANLENADLSRVSALKASFAGARCDGANLQRFIGDGADLRGARLSGADLRNARLHDAAFDLATLHRVSASKADLSGSRFLRADLTGAVLRAGKLTGANLAHAVLESVDLRDADLERANMFGASRRTAKLNGANTRDLVETDPDAPG